MTQDNVGAALELILEEVESVREQLVEEGAAAFRTERLDDVANLRESAKRLLAFRTRLEQLAREWESQVDVETRERVKVEPASGERRAARTACGGRVSRRASGRCSAA